jgi:UTP:GlnB (protein PII) uridylyltransferase
LEYPDDTSQAVEALMKDYFLRAKRIQGFCESMIRHAFPPARRVGRSFKSNAWTTTVVHRGALAFPDEDTLTRHPANMLKLFYRSAKYQIPISEKALNQVKQHLALIDNSVRGSAEVRDLFLKLLRQQKVYDVLFACTTSGCRGSFPSLTRFAAMSFRIFFTGTPLTSTPC